MRSFSSFTRRIPTVHSANINYYNTTTPYVFSVAALRIWKKGGVAWAKEGSVRACIVQVELASCELIKGTYRLCWLMLMAAQKR